MVVQNLDIRWWAEFDDKAPVETVVTDKNSGEKLATQDLPGYGHHPVSIALSPDNHLIIAIHGYLISLDTNSLDILWYRSVPEWDGLIHLALTKSGIYTASAGVVCQYDYTNSGAPKVTRVSSAKAETRLSVREDIGVFLTGIAGYVTYVDKGEIRWTKRLDNVSGVTSVIFKDLQGLFADGDGYVYELNEFSGEILTTADVGAHAEGYAEVNFTMEPDYNRLYVGTNGFGVCLNTIGLEVKYARSFPKSGNHVTAVCSIQGTAMFGSQGRVFQLDEDGEIVGRNDMSGYGDSNNNVTFLAPDHVLTSPDGYLAMMKMEVVPEIVTFNDEDDGF